MSVEMREKDVLVLSKKSKYNTTLAFWRFRSFYCSRSLVSEIVVEIVVRQVGEVRPESERLSLNFFPQQFVSMLEDIAIAWRRAIR